MLGRGWSPERALYLGSGLLMAGVAVAMLALNAKLPAWDQAFTCQ